MEEDQESSGYSESNINQLLLSIKSMHSQGYERQVMKQKLIELGFDDEAVDICFDQFMKLRAGQQRRTGFTLVLIGAFILVISCILTIIFFHKNQSLDLVMYGLSGIGVIILIIGFTYIF